MKHLLERDYMLKDLRFLLDIDQLQKATRCYCRLRRQPLPISDRLSVASLSFDLRSAIALWHHS